MNRYRLNYGDEPPKSALDRLRAALAEFNQIEATDADGQLTANAGIGLALAVGDYLRTLE